MTSIAAIDTTSLANILWLINLCLWLILAVVFAALSYQSSSRPIACAAAFFAAGALLIAYNGGIIFDIS